jgi:hypothetical protein
MARAIAVAIAPAIAEPMAEGIGGSNSQAKPSHYLATAVLSLSLNESLTKAKSVTREPIGFGGKR